MGDLRDNSRVIPSSQCNHTGTGKSLAVCFDKIDRTYQEELFLSLMKGYI